MRIPVIHRIAPKTVPINPTTIPDISKDRINDVEWLGRADATQQAPAKDRMPTISPNVMQARHLFCGFRDFTS